jgi:2-methylisocitrate lyase-like PEP mutase family enzyme
MTLEKQAQLAAHFQALHQPGRPLLLPNPWDAGAARLLASLGFEALATTSSGFAATLGRLDGSVSREESLRHAATIVAATELPVSADLENGFGIAPEQVAVTAAEAVGAGQEAGADVLYAPGICTAHDVRRLVESVDRPVNVLARPGVPSVSELAALGVSRVSVGGAFAFAAIGAVVEAALELSELGTYGFAERAAAGVRAARSAFG